MIIQKITRKNGNVYNVKMEKTFYVYIDTKPDGEVFYVGMGSARRVRQKKRNRQHQFVINKYPDWKRDIVFSGTEEDCLKEEMRLVNFYGRKDLKTGTLVNLCDGGKGVAKYIRTDEEIERLSKRWAGKNNPLFNSKVYKWVNLDTGNVDELTVFEMHKKYGGCRPHWTSVINNDRKSHVGWSLQSTKINVRSSKGKIYTFANDFGETFFGTQGDIVKKTGMSVASASRIVHKNYKTLGWYVKN